MTKPLTLFLALAIVMISSCRDRPSRVPNPFKGQKESASFDFDDIDGIQTLPSATLISSGLERKALSVLEQAAVNSPKVKWSPLSPAVLKRASSENRPILLACVAPDLNSSNLFNELERNAEFTKMLDAYFVPVVADIRVLPQLAPECELSVIHSKGKAASFPIFIILSPSGIPIMNIGIAQASLEKGLNQTVYKLTSIGSNWSERGNFYEQDGLKMLYRRVAKNKQTLFGGEETSAEALLIDLVYGLINRLETSELINGVPTTSAPAMLINALFDIADNPDFSKSLRSRAKEQAIRFGEYLAFSGLYIGHVGCYSDGTFLDDISLPRPVFSIRNQLGAIRMLRRLHAATGEDFYLQHAVSILKWVDKNLKTDSGYARSCSIDKGLKERMKVIFFTYQELKDYLNEEQLGFLETTTGISPEGNLTYNRDGFEDQNLLQARDGLNASAEAVNLDVASYIAKRTEIDQILRSKIALNFSFNELSDIESTANYGLIQLELFAATGAEDYLQTALSTYEQILKNFRLSDGSFRRIVQPEGFHQIPATSSDLVTLARLALLLHSANEGGDKLKLAQDLVKEIESRGEGREFTLELPPEQQLFQLSAPNLLSVDGDSSISGLSDLQKILACTTAQPRRSPPIEPSYSEFITRGSGFSNRVISILSRNNQKLMTKPPETPAEKAKVIQSFVNGTPPSFVAETSSGSSSIDQEILTQIRQGKAFIEHDGEIRPADPPPAASEN